MNITRVIEGGLAGASTLSLIQEALNKIDPKAPAPFLHKSGNLKKLQKQSGVKAKHTSKLYIKLAGEVLACASYFGLTGLGKRKNAVARGALLGAMAGLGTAFLNEDEAKKEVDKEDKENGALFSHQQKELKKRIETILLFTAGGLLAGLAVKKVNKRTIKKLRKKFK